MVNTIQKNILDCLKENHFLPAGRESHAIIKNFDSDNLLYELTPCLIVTWSGELEILYKIMDGFLCIANFYPDGDFSYYIIRPSSRHNLQHIVDTLYGLTHKAGLNSLPVWNIEERCIDDYIRLDGYRMETRFNDNFSEYVYSADSLLDLNGESHYYKRKRVKMFMNKSNVYVEDMNKENISRCLDIEKQWCGQQNCELCRSFAGCSKKSLEIMIDIFDGDSYQGLIGYVDKIPSGYLIFERPNKDLAYIHFIKSAIPNFSVYLYYIAVQRYLQNVRQINSGADLGKKGLQLFKKNMGEHILLKKIICNFIKES
jgi:hypothetical protein